jgi:hypothetical protein
VQNAIMIGAGFAEEDTVQIIIVNSISLDALVSKHQLIHAVKIFL